MRIKLSNINKISTADIKLDGLSVIVGENSTGKSTVGRVLFSTVKALANTTSNDERRKTEQIEKHISSLYKRLAASISYTKTKEMEDLFPRLIFTFINELDSTISLDEFINRRVAFIDNLEIAPRQKSLMKQDLENIRLCKKDNANIEARLSAEMQYLIESEFLNKICANDEDIAEVSFAMYDNNPSLRYNISKENRIIDIECIDNGDFFQDATYIESPLYLHMQNALRRTYTYREIENARMSFNAMIPLHIKDIVDKMEILRYSNGINNNCDVHLDEIVGGGFEYDKNRHTIEFKQDGHSYSPINVASGIKSFGILQILLDGNLINENRILIWDEPENHLHPQWQIELAKVLVQLADAGIPILISTHSPYFLQAIRFFSAGYPIEKYVNYYLAENIDNRKSIITDISEDLNRAFLQLARPLNDIMNVDAERIKNNKG